MPVIRADGHLRGHGGRIAVGMVAVIMWVVAVVGLSVVVTDDEVPRFPWLILFGAIGMIACVGSLIVGFWRAVVVSAAQTDEARQRPS